jgi:hypothetical protein
MLQLPIYRVKMKALIDYLYQVFHIEHYNFLRCAGVVPGQCPEYYVKAAVPENLEQKAQALRDGHFCSNVPLILNVLCLDGYIPSGRYIIDTHPAPPPIDIYTSLMKKRLDASHPECAAFKKANSRNKTFMAQAAVIDKMIKEATEQRKVKQ